MGDISKGVAETLQPAKIYQLCFSALKPCIPPPTYLAFF